MKETASGSKFFVFRMALMASMRANGVDQIVGARSERRIDLVIGKAAALFQDEARAIQEKIQRPAFQLQASLEFFAAHSRKLLRCTAIVMRKRDRKLCLK